MNEVDPRVLLSITKADCYLKLYFIYTSRLDLAPRQDWIGIPQTFDGQSNITVSIVHDKHKGVFTLQCQSDQKSSVFNDNCQHPRKVGIKRQN